MEAEAEEAAQEYNRVEWLWYLRRVPDSALRGHLITTEVAAKALAETLSGLSHRADDNRRPDHLTEMTYNCGPSSLRPVAHLVALAELLSDTHAWLRRAGKGTSFTTCAYALPEPMPDPDLERAISDYDERCARERSLPWHPAVDSLAPFPESEDLPIIGVGQVPGDRGTVLAWRGPMIRGEFGTVEGKYGPVFLTLNGLRESVTRSERESGAWWSPVLPSLVLLLWAFSEEILLRSEFAGRDLPRVGYLRRGRTWLRGMLDAALTRYHSPLTELFPNSLPQSGDEALALLCALKGQLWPHLHGPVIRSCTSAPFGIFADHVVIDLVAATRHLEQITVTPPDAGGGIVNINADRFEQAAQEAIDQSVWRPQPELAVLRGRHLRLHGTTLTDLDAIGFDGRDLLIVSCKNIVLTAAYHAGEYAPVRNAKSALMKAVDRWKIVADTLLQNPRGDNYVLPDFRRILAIVLTPQVVFLDGPEGREILADHDGCSLRRVLSLHELKEYLTQTGTGPITDT